MAPGVILGGTGKLVCPRGFDGVRLGRMSTVKTTWVRPKLLRFWVAASSAAWRWSCPFAIAKAFGLDAATRLRSLHRLDLKGFGTNPTSLAVPPGLRENIYGATLRDGSIL